MNRMFLCILMTGLLGNCNSPNAPIEDTETVELNLPHDRPNILVILTDDQGYHDVSYYGTEDIRTPNIDALAADGMRFDRFYANCPVCSPTRASLLTGRYPDQVGVPGVIRTKPQDNWGYLKEDVPLLPQPLNEAGYHTAIVGKWHLGLSSPNTPTERGFHYFKGWLGDMMEDYVLKRRHDINYMRENDKEIDPPGHATDLFTEWAVDYIEDQKTSDQPFFLYLAYNAPHFPVQPPQNWLDQVKSSRPNLSEKRAKLVAFIEHLDDGIGQVIEALKATGQYDNTLIVFTSDNGGLLRDEANNGPLRNGKQSVYEGGLRVPTCFVWKEGGIEPGSTNSTPTISMDLFPTFLEVAMDTIGYSNNGQSLLPLLKGQTSQFPSDRPLYFVRREGGTWYGGLTIQAVQYEDWKLLQNSPFERPELYNLAEDPYEKNNLIEDQPEKYRSLNAMMMKFIQAGGQVPWQK